MDFEHLPHAELVAAYLDGEASPDERALVERLLAEQPEYQQFAAEWQSLTGSLSALPKRRLEVDLSSAVLSAIAQRAPLVAPPEIAVQAEIAPTVALDRTRDAGALPLVAPAGGSVHASGEAAARDAAAEKTSATVAPSEDDSARPGDADWFERLPLATAPRTGMRLRWWTIGLVVSAAAVVLLMLAAPDGPLTPSQLSLQFDHGGGERVTTQSGAAPSGAVERAPTSSAPSPNFAPVPATKDELGRPFAGEAESVRQMDLLREEDADHTAVAPAEKQQESADKQEAADKGGMRKALPSDVNRRGGVRRSAGENARPDGFDAAPGAGDAVDQPVPAAPLQRPSRPAPTSQPAPAMAPASMGEPASGPAPPAVPRPTPEPPTTTAAGAKSPAAAPLAPPLPAPPGPRGMNRENAETRQQTEAETAAETMEKRSPSPKGAFRDPARPDAPRGPGAFGGVGGGAGAAMPGRPVELQAPAPSGAPASAAPSPSGDARERDFKGEAAKFGEAAKKEAAKQEANGTAAGASADRDAATSRWTAPTSDVAGQSEPGDSAATRKKLENGSDKLNRGTLADERKSSALFVSDAEVLVVELEVSAQAVQSGALSDLFARQHISFAPPARTHQPLDAVNFGAAAQAAPATAMGKPAGEAAPVAAPVVAEEAAGNAVAAQDGLPPAESEALTRSRQELVRAAESQQAVVANGRAAPVQLGLFVEGDAARIDSLLADVKSQRALFDVAWAKRAAADYAPANEPATDGRLAAESYYLFTQAVQYFGRWGMNPAPAAEPRPGAALAGPLPAAGVDGSNLPPGDVPPPAAAAPGEPAAASAMAADSTTAGTRPLGDERPLSAGVVAGEGATAGTAGAPALDAPASLSAAAEAKAPGPVGVAGTTQTFQGGADRRDSATPVQTGWDAAGGTASVVQVTPNSDGLSVYFAWFDVDESKQLKADGENAPGAPQTNLGLAATAPNATRYRLTFDDAINDPAADDATRLGTAATPAQSQPASERGKADERAAAGKPTDDAQRSLEGMPQSDAPARGARPGDKNPAAGGDEKPAQDQKAQPTDREGFSKESGKKPANDEKPVNAARREVMPADLDGAAGRSGDEPNLDEQVAPGSLRKMQEKGKPGSLPTTGLAEVRDEETIPARRRVLFLLKLNAPPAAPANPVPAAPAPAAPAKR